MWSSLRRRCEALLSDLLLAIIAERDPMLLRFSFSRVASATSLLCGHASNITIEVCGSNMDDLLASGYAMCHGDLWAPSVLLTGYSDDSIFAPPELNLPVLQKAVDDEDAIFDLKIPDLPGRDDSAEAHVPLEDVPKSLPAAHDDDESFADVWSLEGVLSVEKDAPRLRTWEAFTQKDVPQAIETALLSEGGPAAFDAYITLLEPRNESGVLPQDYMLRALCNLALGRASSLFQWNEPKMVFEQTLPGVTISGSSNMCSESFTTELIEMGSAIARLRTYAALPRSVTGRCTALLAFQKCLSEVLDAVDESLTASMVSVRSLLQLHGMTRQARRLVLVLDALVKAVRHQETDEAVISSLSDRIHLQLSSAPEFKSTLHAVLARISRPWLEELASQIGFSTCAATLASKESKPGEATNLHFVSSEDRELLHETRLAITALRKQEPAHPLLVHSHSTEDSPLSCFVNETYDVTCVAELAGTYRTEMLRQMSGEEMYDKRPTSLGVARVSGLIDQVWHDEASRVEYFVTLEKLMSADVNHAPPASIDHIKEHVWSLCQDTLETGGDQLSYNSTFAPLERVRPLIKVQNRLVNGVLLRQLFREHKLREHLGLQRSFHLFGNGEFVSRLSTALFSQDVQSAERRRGKLPTSEAMGLRLGTTHEERWPPASSELQLTLMGILVDCYNGRRIGQRTTVQSQELPGALSFSIRELPEEEIDRVLDPNSIYALDFLRLQYTAQHSLRCIMTGEILQKYDDIFKHLLRLLRIVHVTADLGRKAAARRNETANENAASFAHAAHHLISVLLSHAMDVSIATPWLSFLEALDKLETTLAQEDAAAELGTKTNIGIEGLRQLHESCLGRIRSRLLLKRKQERLRNAMEALLAGVLKAALAIHHDQSEEMPAFTSAHDDFRKSLSKFLALLHEQTDRPPKSIASDDIEDAEMLRVLLARLNWNQFY